MVLQFRRQGLSPLHGQTLIRACPMTSRLEPPCAMREAPQVEDWPVRSHPLLLCAGEVVSRCTELRCQVELQKLPDSSLGLGVTNFV